MMIQDPNGWLKAIKVPKLASQAVMAPATMEHLFELNDDERLLTREPMPALASVKIVSNTCVPADVVVMLDSDGDVITIFRAKQEAPHVRDEASARAEA